MSKYADRYFTVDPWIVGEKGFNPSYARVAESVFSLGNEYMGLRGYFEEGYSGDRLQGSYLNGVYEQRQIQKSGYKGIIDYTEFMVNAVDWTYLRIYCNSKILDINQVRFSDFERHLDLRTGLLHRSFIWHVDQHTDIRLTFKRFLSMDISEIGGQQLVIDVLKGTCEFVVESSLDFSIMQQTMDKNFWTASNQLVDGPYQSITGVTQTTKQKVRAIAKINHFIDGQEIPLDAFKSIISYHEVIDNKRTGHLLQFHLNQGQSYVLNKLAYIDKEKKASGFTQSYEEIISVLETHRYDTLKEASESWWKSQWELSDIIIEGDPYNQQGIRFCIFQLHQTLHTANDSAVIGAKGLTGEAYNGNTFWDSEVYCLPFYLFNNPKAARSILDLRYDTLEAAKNRAKALDCQGAFYPIATISGHECCDLWQHASLQLQASTAVMYGIWHYVKITGDKVFLFDRGVEMLVEISRMLASRGAYSATTGHYGFYGVMGPDEFQMMINHNTYTNYMGKKTFDYTLEVLEDMKANCPKQYQLLRERLNLNDEEILAFEDMSKHMLILYDGESKLFEQHEGYYDLPHIDPKAIPVEEFPLYHHWTYDRIYRNDMLKQPDVLMFMLMYNSEFSDEQIKANFDFYEPRCIHESSLSPSVHSILAAQIGKQQEAYDFFGFATRMDLDNYNRNTNEGLHTTSIAGSWMNIVYGFGGFRSDGEALTLAPMLPSQWDSYEFKIIHQGILLDVSVSKEGVTLKTKSGAMDINVYKDKVTVSDIPITKELKYELDNR